MVICNSTKIRMSGTSFRYNVKISDCFGDSISQLLIGNHLHYLHLQGAITIGSQ